VRADDIDGGEQQGEEHCEGSEDAACDFAFVFDLFPLVLEEATGMYV
jgi:hypothetical protein